MNTTQLRWRCASLDTRADGYVAARKRACERERILRGWTREQLALAAGVDPKTVRDMLNGRRRPTLGTIGEVARALERPIADLLVIVEAVSAVAPRRSWRSRSAAAAEATLPLDL